VSALDLAVTRLKVDEGFRAAAYRDTVGKLTIGYGFCVDAGISQFAAAALLVAQAQERAQALAGFWWAQGLDEARMSVVIEIAFNDGLAGLLHFPKMLAGIGAKNWQAAHDECLDSDAARALPARYKTLAQILLTGAAA
jgi:lysozyme